MTGALALTHAALCMRVRVSQQHAITEVVAADACGVVVLLLADGSVVTHELPSLKPCGALERAVDCTSIALLRSDSAEHCHLAAAGRKKLVVYRWRAASAAVASDGAAPPLFESESAGFEPIAEVHPPSKCPRLPSPAVGCP